MIAALQALWFAPAGALVARRPTLIAPAAVFVTQSVTTVWALLDLAVLAAAAVLALEWAER